MLGAGVFIVWGPALATAGRLLVLAVVLAGLVAAINAASSAQLASRYPVAGGAYAYGRAELGRTWGFVAGFAFVVGKTASVAAVALAIGHYAWPDRATLVAALAIAASWTINARGVTRTAAGATAIGAVVLAGVAYLMLAAWRNGPPPVPAAPLAAVDGPTLAGVAAAAALVFFAFAGYARIATLGEEVRDPARTIPRAIAAAFVLVIALYLLVAAVVSSYAEASAFSAGDVPVLELARSVGANAAVAVLAPLSAFGALLALTAGIGRTAMAMARERDLPRFFALEDDVGVPWIAEGTSAAASIVLVLAGDVTFVLAMSACAVLVYYAIANLAAARAARAGRLGELRVPPAVSSLGALACVALAASVPWRASLAAALLLAAGVAVRATVARRPHGASPIR